MAARRTLVGWRRGLARFRRSPRLLELRHIRQVPWPPHRLLVPYEVVPADGEDVLPGNGDDNPVSPGVVEGDSADRGEEAEPIGGGARSGRPLPGNGGPGARARGAVLRSARVPPRHGPHSPVLAGSRCPGRRWLWEFRAPPVRGHPLPGSQPPRRTTRPTSRRSPGSSRRSSAKAHAWRVSVQTMDRDGRDAVGDPVAP
jgi:hypothetical protein